MTICRGRGRREREASHDAVLLSAGCERPALRRPVGRAEFRDKYTMQASFVAKHEVELAALHEKVIAAGGST